MDEGLCGVVEKAFEEARGCALSHNVKVYSKQSMTRADKLRKDIEIYTVIPNGIRHGQAEFLVLLGGFPED